MQYNTYTGSIVSEETVMLLQGRVVTLYCAHHNCRHTGMLVTMDQSDGVSYIMIRYTGLEHYCGLTDTELAAAIKAVIGGGE